MDDFNIEVLKRLILVAISQFDINALSSYENSNIKDYTLYDLYQEFYGYFYDDIVFYPSHTLSKASVLYGHLLDDLPIDFDTVHGIFHMASSRIYRHTLVESIYTISDFFPCLYTDFFGCNTIIRMDSDKELFHVIVPFNDDSLDNLFPFSFLESCLDNLFYTQSLFSILK